MHARPYNWYRKFWIISLLLANAALAGRAEWIASWTMGPDASATASHHLDYPRARRESNTENYHGNVINDPYRWMEDMKSSETAGWVREQDKLLKNYLDGVPQRDDLRHRIRELTGSGDTFTTPVKAGGSYYFMSVNVGGGAIALYVRDGASSPPRMVMDPRARFHGNVSLSSFSPSPDGRWIAYAISKDQSSWLSIRILDAKTGKDLKDVALETNVVSASIAWRNDSKGFFYTQFDRCKDTSDDKAAPAHPRVNYYSRSDAQSTVAYQPQDENNLIVSYAVTKDDRYLVLRLNNGSSKQSRILYEDLERPERTTEWLIKEANANYVFLGSEGTQFWLYTDFKAPNGRVIAIDISRPETANWLEVVPEASEPIAANSSVGGNTLGMLGNRFVLMYLKDGTPLLKVFNKQGRLEIQPDLPKGGQIWGGLNAREQDTEVFYQYLGLTDVTTIYRLDLEKKTNDVFYRSRATFDRASIAIEQVFYRSKDGTRVPMFVAHKKELKLDGSHPTFMYGYGAFGWVSFMWYQPFVLNWLEMGGVYAQPSIRGGGEYGEAWHQAGAKHNKQNAIDDYIAAAEWLIAKRYTSSSRLVANGGSASGALAAAAIIQRPELFAAAVIDRPVLDLLRFDRFTQAGYWIPEFGSPGDPDDFKVLRAWSPYQNVNPGQCYPAMLVMSGDRDQVAVPLHAYKFTAAMQAAQGCENPVLLKVMWGAGHNFGLTADQTSDSWGDQTAFLYRVLGLQTSQQTAK